MGTLYIAHYMWGVVLPLLFDIFWVLWAFRDFTDFTDLTITFQLIFSNPFCLCLNVLVPFVLPLFPL